MNPQYALFANYLKSPQVYLCPTDRDTVKVNNVVYPKLRSYAMNAYLGWKGSWDSRLSSNYKVFTRFTRLSAAMPKGTFLFQDVNPDSICWPFFGVQMDNDTMFNFPGASHSRGTVISSSNSTAMPSVGRSFLSFSFTGLTSSAFASMGIPVDSRSFASLHRSP